MHLVRVHRAWGVLRRLGRRVRFVTRPYASKGVRVQRIFNCLQDVGVCLSKGLYEECVLLPFLFRRLDVQGVPQRSTWDELEGLIHRFAASCHRSRYILLVGGTGLGCFLWALGAVPRGYRAFRTSWVGFA